ncbi:MAG: translation initiation factor IF-2 subunit gamma [Nanoarchaeota archaeon]|nr:translation initiation factor IF-2 subunit gamma [Nanoarchaeota archaeon]
MVKDKQTNKEEFVDIEKLPMLNVGIFGHIDHGKTTLLQRLSGKWTDTHSEELKRGITIKLGYADAIIRKKGDDYNIKEGDAVRYITFVDAPGHEMLMVTMLSGAAIIDAAILVVAANEGIKPQTREHLIALDAKNINNIIVVQNKIDLVEKHEAVRNFKQIKDFLKGTIAENAPIIPVSAQQEVNINKLLEELCKIDIPERDLKCDPMFIIARSFDVNKPGTKISDLQGGVLGGSLKCGTLKVGDEIEIKPGINYKRENQIVYDTIKTKITKIFRGKYEIKEAIPGGSLALQTDLDPNVSKADSLSSQVVGTTGKLPEITFDVKLKLNLFDKVIGTDEKIDVGVIKHNELLLLSLNTMISVGNVIKVTPEDIEIALKVPIIPFKGDKVGLARNLKGHWRLIGFGELI